MRKTERASVEMMPCENRTTLVPRGCCYFQPVEFHMRDSNRLFASSPPRLQSGRRIATEVDSPALSRVTSVHGRDTSIKSRLIVDERCVKIQNGRHGPAKTGARLGRQRPDHRRFSGFAGPMQEPA